MRRLTLLPRFSGLALALMLSAPVSAQQAGTPPDAPVFEGRIEVMNSADLSASVESIVTEILFEPGQRVEAGQPLIRLDDADFKIRLKTAQSNVVRAELTLNSARRDFQRTKELTERGTATSVSLFKSESALTLADAIRAKAQADMEAAQNEVDRTVLRAPISGVISAPLVALGAFVKPSNRALARIVQLDPIRLSYEVPYVERVEALGLSDLNFPGNLLETLRLRVIVSDSWIHPEPARPRFVSPDVDPLTGTLTIWAEVANPSALLRPGMNVRVQAISE